MKKSKTKKSTRKKNVKSSKIKRGTITKEMTFMEVMNKDPKAAWVLMEHGMQCAGCGMAANETLEQGAMAHGIDPDKLIEEINKKIRKSKNND